MASPELSGNINVKHHSGNLKKGSKHLFKYTGLDRIKSCVENGVYAANISDLNDPFEYSGIEYPEEYRVVCLTNSETKMLMWAYYGNHQNCCIEFELDSNLADSKLLKPVDYVSEFRDHSDMNDEELIQALYCKGSEWSHEKEWRAVWHKDNKYALGIWNNKSAGLLFLNARVVAVTFGLASIKNPEYENALQYLLDYNKTHTRKIRIQKCKVSANKYEIKIDRQFKAEKELTRLKGTDSSGIRNNVDVHHEVYDFGDEDAEDLTGNFLLGNSGASNTSVHRKPKLEIAWQGNGGGFSNIIFKIKNVSSIIVSNLKAYGLIAIFNDGSKKEVEFKPHFNDTSLNSGDVTALYLNNHLLGAGVGYNNAYWSNFDLIFRITCEDEEDNVFQYEVSKHINDAESNEKSDVKGAWDTQYIA